MIQTDVSALRPRAGVLRAGLAALLLLAVEPALAADVGYRDFYFGTTVNSTPTGEKPECKLWYNDGSWWGSLWSDADLKYHVYELDWNAQTWSDTGTAMDDRKSSKADILWDDADQKLYVASSVFNINPGPQTGTTNPNRGRLYRYSYGTVTPRTYSLDAGFPVNINSASAEDLTLARDSTGKLWATWVQKLAATDAVARVMANCSLTSDADWGTPFILPTVDAGAATVQRYDGTSAGDTDISAIIAFDGKVGVMWTNQLTHTFYFSVHVDGDADGTWQAEELVVPDPSCSSLCADDHLSVPIGEG